MVKAYSLDLWMRVIYHNIFNGESNERIADYLFVSKSWVKKVKGSFRRHGLVGLFSLARGHIPRKLSGTSKFLVDLICEYNFLINWFSYFYHKQLLKSHESRPIDYIGTNGLIYIYIYIGINGLS